MSNIVRAIKKEFPDCALTLSIGEKDEEYYKELKNNGANRFLLRHETSENEHYSKLHPKYMSLDNRKECLRILKRLGFQTGTGIMVGSPFQKLENIASDLIFMQEIKPEAIIEKMVEGRMRKYYEESVLLEQAFVMDPDKKVKDVLAESGCTATAFVRYNLGEGIEKKQEDFATEVAKQMG